MKDLVEIAKKDVSERFIEVYASLDRLRGYLRSKYDLETDLFLKPASEKTKGGSDFKLGIGGVMWELSDIERDIYKLLEKYKKE